MTKRFFVLLLATIAFSGGLLALRANKGGRRPVAAITTNIPSLKLDEPSFELAPSQRESLPHFLTPRLAGLAVLAIILCAGAYFGLGKGSETARAAVQSESVASISLAARAEAPSQKIAAPDDEVLSLVSRSALARAAAADASLSPPAAPTPAVSAEIATPATTPAATPIPIVTAAPVAAPAATDGLEAIICALPWPCSQAIGVARCESGADRNGRLDGNWATNGNNYGLFQINGIHAHRWADFYDAWMDPAKNAQWAYEIWSQSGWGPWDCRWAAY